ncbi:phosphoribosyltransferase [Nanoarchaeota archaeon]
MAEKKFITPNQLLYDSFLLGKNVLDSNFTPNFIVAIWRGGTPIGIAVQELLDYNNVKTDHISIRTSSYTDIEKAKEKINVHALDYLIENLNADDKLLIVDDVFDRGLSVKAVLDTLKIKCKKNFPKEVRVAVVYFKPRNNKTELIPDFFVHKTDKWLVFPHELQGLSKEEIKLKGDEIYSLLK